MDYRSIESSSWFPGEETCRLQRVPEWVRRQRRIDKATGGDLDRGAFTVKLLERRCIITSAMQGLDPNRGPFDDETVGNWLAKHPAVKRSAKQREATRKMARSVGQSDASDTDSWGTSGLLSGNPT